MSLAAVRKVALSGFLFPRHMMPMLTKPIRTEVPVRAYHEVCGFVRVSGDHGRMFDRPDLLDVLRAPR